MQLCCCGSAHLLSRARVCGEAGVGEAVSTVHEDCGEVQLEGHSAQQAHRPTLVSGGAGLPCEGRGCFVGRAHWNSLPPPSRIRNYEVLASIKG